MGVKATVRVVFLIVAIAILLISIAFAIAAFMTTAWQVYYDPGTEEIHQHGLWLDFYYNKIHAAARDNHNGWLSKIKFGDAVHGDEVHRARDYQINTLILMCLGTLLAIIGAIFSCCATISSYAIVGWILTTFMATILCTAGVIVFYIAALSNRFVDTDRKLEQVVGYSFWCALVATTGFFISMILALAYGSTIFIARRRQERNGFQSDTRPKVLTPRHHITSL